MMKKRLGALLFVLVLLLTALSGGAAEEKEPRLILTAVARYPRESYPLDLMGRTESISYLLTVTNAGEAACALQSLCFQAGDHWSADSFPDTVLEAGQSVTFLHEQRFSREDILPDTEKEDILGEADILFMVIGGENSEYVSNEALVSQYISAAAADFPSPGAELVQVRLKVNGASVHPAGYQAGERISYQVQVTNLSSQALSGLLLEELSGGDAAARQITTIDGLASGEQRTVAYTHTVNESDLSRGYLYSAVSAVWTDPATQEALASRSAPKVVMTLRGVSAPQPAGGGVQLTASLVSTPANGSYYVPSETVRISLRAVNASSSALNQVKLLDLADTGAGFLAEISSLLPGEETTAELACIVTEADALLGSLCRAAAVQAADVYGNRELTVSELLTVPVGQAENAAPNIRQGLTLVQRETSAPAQGGAYRAGETVSYEIIAFHVAGEGAWDVSVRDILADGPDGLVGRVEQLGSGDFARFTFDHTVTEAEEQAGRVTAWAYATAEQDGTYLGMSRAAAPSVSPAGNGEAVSQGSFDLPLSGDGCSLTLLAKGSDAAEYSQHYCARHAEISKTVNDLTAAAETDDALLAAWEQAAVLWTEELEALYTDCLATASGTARMAVIQERIASLESLKSLRALMDQVYAETSSQSARFVAEEAMRRCMELFCHGHSAPNDRPDSLFQNGLGKIVSTSAADACGRRTLFAQDETVHYRDTLCAAHCMVEEAAETLLENADNGQSARELWFSALRTSLNERYEKGGEETKATVGLYLLRMNQYLAAHAETLALLYPDDPQAAQEAAAQSVMRAVLALCREGLD